MDAINKQPQMRQTEDHKAKVYVTRNNPLEMGMLVGTVVGCCYGHPIAGCGVGLLASTLYGHFAYTTLDERDIAPHALNGNQRSTQHSHSD